MNNKQAATMRISGNAKVSEAYPVVGEFPTDKDIYRIIQMGCMPTIFTHHASHTPDWLNSQRKG